MIKALLTCLLAMPFLLKSYIYDTIALQKIDASSKVLQNVIGLSDFHDKTHPCTGGQLMCIKNKILLLNAASTRFFLEDLSSHGSGNRLGCGKFFVNSRGGILGGLAQFCKQHAIRVENVEYRYCRVASLGPILNAGHLSLTDIPSAHDISIASLVREIQDIIDEVMAYHDGPLINAWYQQGINQIKAELKKMKLMQHMQYSVAHYMINYSNNHTRFDMLKKLLTFDSMLIDFKLVHGILHAREKKIVAIAGGSHIVRVMDMLQQSGYHIVRASGNEQKKRPFYDSISSTIMPMNTSERPVPISVDELDTILSYAVARL